VDFEFSADQEMLRDSVRRFLSDKAPISYVRDAYEHSGDALGRDAVWDGLRDIGAVGLLVPEEFGGAGMGMVDAAVVLEELGRALCPSPYASTAIGAVSLVLAAGAAREHRFLLPGLADGSTIGTLAIYEPGARYQWRTPSSRVRVEGEVVRPGEYVLPPQSSVADALQAAGGLTPAAYVFGTEFSRESVRITQQENYERALRDLETEFAKATSTQRTSNADEAAAQTARASGTTRLVERLRAIKPNGRVVLQLRPDSMSLPELALEDGDRLYIPPRPTTVGVFGSVFNGGSYLYANSRSVDDYLNLAGGPTRGADQGSVFVIRANGSVVSSPQGRGWFSSRRDLSTVRAEPGDTVFVPEEINKTTFVQDAKDWTQILYQLGLGLAGLNAVRGN